MGFKPFQAGVFEDWLGAFPKGVNSGVAPLLLPKDQLFTALNTSVRGTYARPRPPFVKITLDSATQTLLADMLATGRYQGGCYFQPDNADEGIVAAIGGRAIQITPDTAGAATGVEVTVPGDPNPAAQQQAWLWQSEKWVVWNDSLSLPVFIDGVASVRSNWNIPTTASTTTATTLTIPAPGATGSVDFASVVGLSAGVVFTVQDKGTYIVNSIAGVTVTFTSIDGSPIGQVVPIGAVVTWQIIGRQLPPGRMGVYGMGRNWVCLTDGKQFVASDLVGGSSGTLAENFRDAVLNITENNYLLGGGYFTVPGSLGDITFMIFTSTLDVSLGQGPLQVGTHKSIFSCQAPVDRTTWSDLVNPILTQSLISRGGLGQYSTVNANNDVMMRSLNGILSLILARREFQTWGNTPISREVDATLSKDSPDLLRWGSAVIFDNRLLMTSRPILVDQGVYHEALIPLNFDPVSSLGGKAPSCYDATMWTGLNVLQLFTGEFSGVDRCFALTLNVKPTTPEIELWEILKSSSEEYRDDGTERIVWTFESPIIFNQTNAPERMYLRLQDGEIFVDELRGLVDFQVYYKPDQYPCWIPWFSWQECQRTQSDISKPQFRPQMGLGQPSGAVCDENTGKPMREGWGFQVKVVISGQCRFLGARFQAVSVPDPCFAKQTCEEQCSPTYVPGDDPRFCNERTSASAECSSEVTYTFTVAAGTYCAETQAEADLIAREAAIEAVSLWNRVCLNSTVPDYLCADTEVTYAMTVTGGSEPFTWEITSGALPTGMALTGTSGRTVGITGTPTAAGEFSFTITITDTHGGVLVYEKTITVVELALVVTPSLGDAACNSTATADASGGTGYTYLWSDGQTTQTAVDLCEGEYTVTVTDTASGCTIEGDVSIVLPLGVSAEQVSPESFVDCVGQVDGSVTCAPFGGTPPYTYLWDDPMSQTTQTATGLAGGVDYSVTVTDSVAATAPATVHCYTESHECSYLEATTLSLAVFTLNTNAARTLNIDRFDSDLGTLLGVTFEMQASIRENNGYSIGNLNYPGSGATYSISNSSVSSWTVNGTDRTPGTLQSVVQAGSMTALQQLITLVGPVTSDTFTSSEITDGATLAFMSVSGGTPVATTVGYTYPPIVNTGSGTQVQYSSLQPRNAATCIATYRYEVPAV